MKEIFMHFPTVMCIKEFDLEYLTIQSEQAFKNTIQTCVSKKSLRSYFELRFTEGKFSEC